MSIPGGVFRKTFKIYITRIANSEQCNHNSVRRFIGWFKQELNKIKILRWKRIRSWLLKICLFGIILTVVSSRRKKKLYKVQPHTPHSSEPILYEIL